MTTRTLPNQLLRLPAVSQLTGLGRDTIYRLARRGDFPQPVRITERCTGWRADEIHEWIASRPTSNRQSPNPRVKQSAT